MSDSLHRITRVRGTRIAIIDCRACAGLANTIQNANLLTVAQIAVAALLGLDSSVGAETPRGSRAGLNEVLIDKPIAIFVKVVASRIGGSARQARFATLYDGTVNAGRSPRGRTNTRSAGRRLRHEAFVEQTVAIFVEAVAGGVDAWSGGLACVDDAIRGAL
jgi:hypothetical protein